MTVPEGEAETGDVPVSFQVVDDSGSLEELSPIVGKNRRPWRRDIAQDSGLSASDGCSIPPAPRPRKIARTLWSTRSSTELGNYVRVGLQQMREPSRTRWLAGSGNQPGVQNSLGFLTSTLRVPLKSVTVSVCFGLPGHAIL